MFINFFLTIILSWKDFRTTTKEPDYYIPKIPWDAKKSIYYAFESSIGTKCKITAALEALSFYTCMEAYEAEEIPRGKQGIIFQGCNGDTTTYNANLFSNDFIVRFCITDKCADSYGCTTHYIYRMFGLRPPHIREDRKEHVFVNYSNVKFPNDNLYFSRYSFDEIPFFDIPYDFGSTAHKDSHYLSKNGLPTLVPEKTLEFAYMIQPNNYNSPTFNDFKYLHKHQCGDQCRSFKPCKNGGYYLHSCYSCICPKPYYGRYCDKIKEQTDKCPSYNFEALDQKQHVEVGGKVECNFLLQAPQGYKVHVNIIAHKQKHELLDSNCSPTKGVNVRFNKDKGGRDLILCRDIQNVSVPVVSNEVLIEYNYLFQSSTYLKFSYWREFDPNDCYY
uniref:Astacin domain-containing protein n=1 Tax=Parastrongyloides trichosuri TaxID=131310 RepID=A0A0N4Z1H4_PARTI